MPRRPLLPYSLAAALLAALAVPVASQNLGFDVMNTRMEISGRMWGSGSIVLYCIEEDQKDLNGDGDTRDSILCWGDLRNMTASMTGIAINYQLTDDDKDWPAGVDPDQNLMAIQVSESENGDKDLNGNGTATDDVLALYNISTKQKTILNVTGRAPKWAGGKLYFEQPEVMAGKDLNGDGDVRDLVLCVYDPKTAQVTSLGAECSAGYEVVGDWIATMTSEAGQGNKDLNGDKDLLDTVVELYQISAHRWLNTGLECELEKEIGLNLTPKLCAFGTNEANQGNRDLNGDKDTQDCVAQVITLPQNGTDPLQFFNTGQDCSAGLKADDNVVAMVTSETAQGNKDLNGDKDTKDDVVQTFTLGASQVQNVGLEGTEGVYVWKGHVAVPVSEQDQGDKDLNGDKDADDYVLHLYDVAKNKIINTKCTVEQNIIGHEGVLFWKVLESDQFNRDLNRDGDTDDSIVAMMDMNTGMYAITGYATSVDEMCPTSKGGVFAVSESDQGGRDLNGDGETDDDIVVLLRKRG
jgi:hypothetical protein